MLSFMGKAGGRGYRGLLGARSVVALENNRGGLFSRLRVVRVWRVGRDRCYLHDDAKSPRSHHSSVAWGHTWLGQVTRFGMYM